MLEDAIENYTGTVQSLISFYWSFIEFWQQTKTEKTPKHWSL